MDLTMLRIKVDTEGAFSNVADVNGNFVMVTGSHTYLQPDGSTFAPVVGPGTYTCNRVNATLGQSPNFYHLETFEITGVAGHWGLLFHPGNIPETQSEGCELVGTEFGELTGLEGVLNSNVAFQRFLALQDGLSSFTLTVVGNGSA